MLWTDSDFISTTDLESLDPEIADIAAAQLLDMTVSIRRGIEEAGRYLEGQMTSFSTYISSNDISSNHLGAVFYTGSQPNQRRRTTLDQIVVTGRNATYWSEIKQWAANRCLVNFYLFASNRAKDDRYEDKMELFTKLDQTRYWPALRASGVPIVYKPMPCPGAVQQRAPGSWTASLAANSGTSTDAVDVAVSYVDQSLYIDEDNTGNAESDVSARQRLTLSAGSGVKADITSLSPPTGKVATSFIARGFTVPYNATGWNLWVGPADGVLWLQNPQPIPISQKTYALSSDPVFSGHGGPLGQWVEAFLVIPSLVERG